MSQPEEKKKERKPKVQHIKFAELYVQSGSLTYAARHSGVMKKGTKNPGQVGWQLLQNPSIQELITAARKSAMERLGMTTEEIIGRLSIISRSNLKNVARWGTKLVDEYTVRQLKKDFENDVLPAPRKKRDPYLIPRNSNELTEAEAFMIESIRVSRDRDGNPITSIKMRSPTAALQQLVEIRRLIGAAEGDETKELRAALMKLDQEEQERMAKEAEEEEKNKPKSSPTPSENDKSDASSDESIEEHEEDYGGTSDPDED